MVLTGVASVRFTETVTTILTQLTTLCNLRVRLYYL